MEYTLFGTSGRDVELREIEPELENRPAGYLPYWAPSTRKRKAGTPSPKKRTPKKASPKKHNPFTTKQNKTYMFTEFI